MKEPTHKLVCKCGKLLKAYTQKQLINVVKKHKRSSEHIQRIKELEEIKFSHDHYKVGDKFYSYENFPDMSMASKSDIKKEKEAIKRKHGIFRFI